MAPPTAEVSPTLWAQKYGIARERWLQNRGKSGISPQLLFDVYVMRGQTAEERKLRSFVALYQVTNFEGLATSNMIRAGAVGEQIGIRPSNLAEIHPLFRRQQWRDSWPLHLAKYPLGDGSDGYWSAGNDAVWRVLKPCLALATKLIGVPDLWYWWDAQAWTDIFPSRPSVDGRAVPSFAFLSRNLYRVQHSNRVGPNRYFQMLAEKTSFDVSSGRVDPETGMPEKLREYEEDEEDKTWDVKSILSLKRGNRLGQKIGHSTVFVAYERLAPLLFDDLSRSETLCLQFEIGVAIVQELAHLIHQQLLVARPWPPDSPPEYKRVPALGESLINMAFGGLFDSVTEYRNRFWHLREKPTLAIIYTKEQELSRERLERQNPRAILEHKIRQAGKISCMYGESALVPKPLTFGVSDMKGPRPERLPDDEDVIMYDYESELDAQSSYTTFLVRDARAKMKNLFGEDENPEMKQRRVLRTELTMDALFKTERIDQLEAEWDPKYGLDSARALTFQDYRLIGQTSQAVFADQSRDGKFDSKMEKPAGYEDVLVALMSYHFMLALPTMQQWIPVPLLFRYLTDNQRETDPFVTIEALYDFLTYCEVKKALFRFKRQGTGLVRYIRHGWRPELRRIPYDRYSDGTSEARENVVEYIFRVKSRLIFDESALHDYEERSLYERFMEVVETYRSAGSLPGGHFAPFDLTEDELFEVISAFSHRAHLFAYIISSVEDQY